MNVLKCPCIFNQPNTNEDKTEKYDLACTMRVVCMYYYVCTMHAQCMYYVCSTMHIVLQEERPKISNELLFNSLKTIPPTPTSQTQYMINTNLTNPIHHKHHTIITPTQQHYTNTTTLPHSHYYNHVMHFRRP